MLSRIACNQTIEANEAAKDALTAEALRFRLAGGFVTLTEWYGLTNDERDALVQAAVLIGSELQGEGAAAPAPDAKPDDMPTHSTAEEAIAEALSGKGPRDA